MEKVLLAVGAKEKKDELTESLVEPSSGEEFIEVWSRKKKRTIQSHGKKRLSRSRSPSIPYQPSLQGLTRKKVTQRNICKSDS